MSRIIKFRAWDKKNKLWHMNPSNLDWLATADGIFEPYILKSSLILMQFTGLHDKNGEEAYFDDIAEDEHGQRFLIEWNYPLLARLQEIPFTIIGNVYEHPELLKQPL